MHGATRPTAALEDPPGSFRPPSCPDGAPGLYLHIPFCSAICPYCDFAVVTGGAERRARFVADLLLEIGLHRDCEAEPDTLYLGGGTPSALLPEQLECLLATLREKLSLVPEAHVTLEANPEDVTAESVGYWRRLGVDRLSLGVQSLDRDALRLLGRRHDPETARRSVVLARAAGFPSISIDLIYGLPQLPAHRWLDTLEQAIGLSPDHLSCYELTVHAGTPFARWAESGRLVELSQDQRGELFELTHARLEAGGYEAYEVSSFARSPTHRSRHNRKYWRHVPYLGLGPSAHSFDGRWRWWNERDLGAYQRRVRSGERPIAGGERLDRHDLALEALMLGLRTREGVDLERLRARSGIDLRAANRRLIARLAEQGLVVDSGSSLLPTRRGLAVAERLALDFELD